MELLVVFWDNMIKLEEMRRQLTEQEIHALRSPVLFDGMHLLCIDVDSSKAEALFLYIHYISHIKDGSVKIHLSETHAY